MIFGLKVSGDTRLVDGLVDEWNEIFKEPVRNIISETRYYKSSPTLKLPENTYVMAIKPIFPIMLWFSIFGLGAIACIIFGWFKLAIILGTILLVMSLFFTPFLYVLGTKYRLKKSGYTGSLKYVKPSEILREIIISEDVE